MSRTPHAAQNAFQDRLGRFINGAFASRSTLLLSLAAPRLAYRREAADVVAGFRATAPLPPAAPGTVPVTVEVPPYQGRNVQARQLMAALVPLQDHLAGAYVHGSIATGEEVGYSDFDALVILRDSAFACAATLGEVGATLGALRRLMFEYDPLQHHGWFVLAERDLASYCQAWFPVVLFPRARALLPGTGERLRLIPRDSHAEYRAAFDGLATSTLRQIDAGPPLHDAYRLKGLLSQFMLLPSLYLQARDGTAVFKKESFAIAARDFTAADWDAMTRVSAVRLAWRYELTAAQRFALTRCVAQRRLVTRWVQAAVPDTLRAALAPDLWAAAARLIRAMQARIAGPGR